MKLTQPNILLSVPCNKCGVDVPILNKMTISYAKKHGITCESCRQGKQWTRETYKEYLKTEHWLKSVRPRALKRAGYKCQVCAKTTNLDTHHNDYSRLGGELMTDVVVLCHSCHVLFHGEDF